MADLHSVSVSKALFKNSKAQYIPHSSFSYSLTNSFSGTLGNNCPTGHLGLFYLFQSCTDFR